MGAVRAGAAAYARHAATPTGAQLGRSDTRLIRYIMAARVANGGPNGTGLVGTLTDEGGADLTQGSDDDYPTGMDFRFRLVCAVDPVTGLGLPSIYEQRIFSLDSAGKSVPQSILITVPAEEDPPPEDRWEARHAGQRATPPGARGRSATLPSRG